MFSANQFAGFFTCPYLQNKSRKYPDFLRIDTNSHNLRVAQKSFFNDFKVGVVKSGQFINSFLQYSRSMVSLTK